MSYTPPAWPPLPGTGPEHRGDRYRRVGYRASDDATQVMPAAGFSATAPVPPLSPPQGVDASAARALDRPDSPASTPPDPPPWSGVSAAVPSSLGVAMSSAPPGGPAAVYPPASYAGNVGYPDQSTYSRSRGVGPPPPPEDALLLDEDAAAVSRTPGLRYAEPEETTQPPDYPLESALLLQGDSQEDALLLHGDSMEAAFVEQSNYVEAAPLQHEAHPVPATQPLPTSPPEDRPRYVDDAPQEDPPPRGSMPEPHFEPAGDVNQGDLSQTDDAWEMSAPAVPREPGVFSVLFDFAFQSFVTPRLARFTFILAVITMVCGWVVAIIVFLADPNGGAALLVTLLVGWIPILLGVAVIRIALESGLALVRLVEHADVAAARAVSAAEGSHPSDDVSPEEESDPDGEVAPQTLGASIE